MSKRYFENIGLTILGLVLLLVLVYVLFFIGGVLASCFSIKPNTFFCTVLMGVCATPLIWLYTLTWDNPPKARKYLLFFACWFYLLLSRGSVTLFEGCKQWLGYEGKGIKDIYFTYFSMLAAFTLFHYLDKKIENQKTKTEQ